MSKLVKIIENVIDNYLQQLTIELTLHICTTMFSHIAREGVLGKCILSRMLVLSFFLGLVSFTAGKYTNLK